MDALAWIDEDAASWTARGLSRSLHPIRSERPGDFVRDDRRLINFGSNDYLGLADDPRTIDAATRAAHRHGWGSGASPLVSGWTTLHDRLARELADFEGTEAALLFPTGYAANVGAIAALVGKPDAVYSDRLNHASIIDGARLSGASIRVYPHADVDALTAMIADDAGRFRRTLIATDGVFSMDGDLAPLDRLADLAERTGAMLLVDEAHGTGVLGDSGRGASELFGVCERIAIKVGTLSKALGSVGGFVAGSRRLIDRLINHARAFIFSTAAPASTVAAAIEALAIVRAEPWRRERVRAAADRVRTGLRLAGFDVVEGIAPIVPILFGEPSTATAFSARLVESGFFVPAIRPPSVPEGTSRLRLTVNARLDDADLDGLIGAFAANRR